MNKYNRRCLTVKFILFCLSVCFYTATYGQVKREHKTIDYWFLKKDSIIIQTKNNLNEVSKTTQIENERNIFYYKGQKVYLKPDSLANYPKGEKALMECIKNNLKCEGNAQIRITVYVCLLISDDGTIESVGIVRGSGIYDYDIKAIELFSKTCRWNTAYHNDDPVYSLITIPATFSNR